MATIDVRLKGHLIRFYGRHWTAFDSGERTRQEVARHLNRQIYTFLHEMRSPIPHAVVFGDLNEEPFSDVLEKDMHAYRDRAHARQLEHHTDRDTSRIRLYNCGWRHLGEKSPHAAEVSTGPSGTYYWASKRTWHSLDQILVTGSLLTNDLPRLNESRIEIFAGPSLNLIDGCPRSYSWNSGKPTGVSDHLPLVGSIEVPGE